MHRDQKFKHILNIIILAKNKYFKYLVLSCFIAEDQISLFSGEFLFFSPSLSRGWEDLVSKNFIFPIIYAPNCAPVCIISFNLDAYFIDFNLELTSNQLTR